MINWFNKHNKISWLITIIMAIIIFYVSSLIFSGSGGSTSYIGYVYHFTAFSYLALFLLISLTNGKYSTNLIILGIILAILYGISDEIHQYFIPGRDSSIKDILINSIGILITGIAYSNSCKKK